jgi:hypothetical protein
MAGIRIPFDLDDLRRRYLAGESKTAIAKSFGVSPHVIAHRLEEVGIMKSATFSEARLIMHSRMTAEQSAAQAVAAHNAVRGMKRTHENLCNRSLGVERAGKFGSDDEATLCRSLRRRGLTVIPQKAEGIYNIDLTVGTIAVEVGRHYPKGLARARMQERVEYLLDAGWTLVVVTTAKTFWQMGPGAADYIVALVEQSSSDPSLRSQYRVIRGDGKFVASGSRESHDLPGILTSVYRKSRWATD